MSKFSRRATAEEVSEGIDLTGKLAIITGASSGIGVETTRVLALRGAHVILAVRDVKKGEAVAQEIVSSNNGKIPISALEVGHLDLGSFQSVRTFAENFMSSKRPLNFLINNAGVMGLPNKQVLEGHEGHFTTNHLSHFLLTVLLAPALVAGAPARIVNLSSLAHKLKGPIDFDDINFEKRPYDKTVAYSHSKTANILFTKELNKLLSSKGVESFALHPGSIKTGLQVYVQEEELKEIRAKLPPGIPERKSIQEGASTTIYAALSPDLNGKGGEYLEDNDIASNLKLDAADNPFYFGLADHAKDENAAVKLWQISEKATGASLSL